MLQKTTRGVDAGQALNWSVVRVSATVLCPVALDEAWETRQYHVKWEHLTDKNILDFSGWKTAAYDAWFRRLLDGLNASYARNRGGDKLDES